MMIDIIAEVVWISAEIFYYYDKKRDCFWIMSFLFIYVLQIDKVITKFLPCQHCSDFPYHDKQTKLNA